MPTRRTMTRKPRQEPFDITSIHEAAETLADLRKQMKRLKEDEAPLSKVVKEGMIASKKRKYIFPTKDGSRVSITYVEPESLAIDGDALKKRLGAALWKKVTSTYLDRKKLDALMAAGEIDSAVVADVSVVQPGTPYVKIEKD